MKSLLILIVENLSEMRAGSYDIPLQLQFDFRFSRVLKKHLKETCRTKFCNYTNTKSHYPRVKSDLRYSELPKCPALVSIVNQVPSAANERLANKAWRSVPQKQPTKDNLTGTDLGGGCRGCAPPPLAELTCGFLIQLVFCKNVVYWCR